MNNSISIEETALRISLLLLIVKKEMSLERITCYDFMTSYLNDYNCKQENLEAISPFEKEEFIIKSEIVTNSLKFLLSYNLISVSYNETGIYYKSNDMSKYFVDLLKSLYKSKIIKQVLWLENNYSNYSDIELENLITNVLNSKSPTFIQYGLIDKEHFKYAK